MEKPVIASAKCLRCLLLAWLVTYGCHVMAGTTGNTQDKKLDEMALSKSEEEKDFSSKDSADNTEKTDQENIAGKAAREKKNRQIAAMMERTRIFPKNLEYWLFGGAFLVLLALVVIKLRSKEDMTHKS